MSFQIDLDKYSKAYGRFMREIQAALQQTYEEEARQGLKQAHIAKELKVSGGVVSRRLNGSGNSTLRSVCDLYTAMGRQPLANFCTQPEVSAHLKSSEALGVWNNQRVELGSSNKGRPLYFSFNSVRDEQAALTPFIRNSQNITLDFTKGTDDVHHLRT